MPADLYFDAGVSVALGTDSQAQIDLLEDARELEYNLRLRSLRRNVLAQARDESHAVGSVEATPADSGEPRMSALAARLFECASLAGAQSIGASCGEFAQGRAADFFTVDLNDPSIAGACAEDLLPAIIFSLSRAAVREVAVGARLVVEGGTHAAQHDVVSRFAALQRRLWESDK
jgi:formimidoylglutamate deiminase